MANAGLSVKERLALLQTNNNNNNDNTTNNNNNHNATNKPASTPAKPLSPKPKPPTAENKPSGPTGFKPVTPNKPATPAPPGHKPGPHPDKPAPSTKPMTPANKPATPHKPTLANKPAPAVKPFTASSSKPGGDDPAWPKLRPAGTGKGTSSESQQSPTRETGGGGAAPAAPASSDSSQGTGGSGTSSETQEKKPGTVFTPLKPVSVQERLAALRRKSSEVESADFKPKHPNHGVSPTSQSSSSTLKPSVFPSPTPASGVSNGQLSENSESAKSEFQGIKRSDIAKSLTQAADRILRNKTATASGDASEEASQRRSHLFQRRSDGKKFRKLDVTSLTSSDPAPTKPRPMHNVDLQLFLKAYAAAKENKLEVDSGHSGEDAAKGEEEEEGEMEEMYVEAESTSVTIRGRKGSVKKATSARVSFIPEFTEEEEEQEIYTDGTSGSSLQQPLEPEETYDDCESALEQTPKHPEPLLEEPDEIYEPFDEEVPEERSPPPPAGPIPPPLPSPNLPEDRRAREEEKENREKEEAAKRKEVNKKEEKERKKKEEDLKKMRRKFGLSESDEKVGEGVVKSNASGGVFSKDLAVTKGETIAILRMDGNPAGKWLVQNEHGKIGFVSSNNIQISTPAIKNLMAGIKHETPGTAEEPEEMYEALPEGEMDEIYEEL